MQAMLPGSWQLAHSGTYTPPFVAMVGALGEGGRNLGVVWCVWFCRREKGVYEANRGSTGTRCR